MRRAVVALLAAVVLALPELARGGAWVLEHKQTNTIVTSSFTYGDHSFDDDGKLIRVPEYRKFTLRGTLEYGIRPRITAIVKGELNEVTRTEFETPDSILFPPPQPEPVTFNENHINIAAGARRELVRFPNGVLSGQLLLESGGFTSQLVADPNDAPAIEGRLLGGVSGRFLDRNVFAELQAGYRFQIDENLPDEIILDTTIGMQVLPRWLVLGQTYSTFRTSGNTQFHKVSASVVRNFTERLRVEVSGETTVYGRNALREFGGKIGFWWNYGAPEKQRVIQAYPASCANQLAVSGDPERIPLACSVPIDPAKL